MATKRVPAWAKDATWAAECDADEEARLPAAQWREINGRLYGRNRVSPSRSSPYWSRWMRDADRASLIALVAGWPQSFLNFRIVKGGGK